MAKGFESGNATGKKSSSDDIGNFDRYNIPQPSEVSEVDLDTLDPEMRGAFGFSEEPQGPAETPKTVERPNSIGETEEGAADRILGNSALANAELVVQREKVKRAAGFTTQPVKSKILKEAPGDLIGATYGDQNEKGTGPSLTTGAERAALRKGPPQPAKKSFWKRMFGG